MLMEVNNMLREQLDQTTRANQSLCGEVQRTRDDVKRFQEAVEQKETERRDQESAFNEYFDTEHGRLLALWRSIVGCRRQFVEIKGQVEREINTLRSDCTRSARACQTACDSLRTNLQSEQNKLQVRPVVYGTQPTHEL